MAEMGTLHNIFADSRTSFFLFGLVLLFASAMSTLAHAKTHTHEFVVRFLSVFYPTSFFLLTAPVLDDPF